MVIEGAGKMGFTHDKIFRLMFLLFLLITLPLSADSDSGVEAELTDFLMPHYHDNKLQFVLYGEKGINLGATITFTYPLIDIVNRKLPSIEQVVSMKGIKLPDENELKINTAVIPNVFSTGKEKDDLPVPLIEEFADPKSLEQQKSDPGRLYPLHSSTKVIFDFWKEYPHSEAVIASDKAEYDKNRRMLTGDGKVYFRSLAFDIDGEGFDADQKRRFIHVRNNVKVVLHPLKFSEDLERHQLKALGIPVPEKSTDEKQKK